MANIPLSMTVSLDEFGKKAAEYALDEITFDAGGSTYTLREFTHKIQKGEFAEVRHGRWIPCDYKTLEHGFIESAYKAGKCCSVCRTGFKANHLVYDAYCPACGAKMDGGETDAG